MREAITIKMRESEDAKVRSQDGGMGQNMFCPLTQRFDPRCAGWDRRCSAPRKEEGREQREERR